jgi:large subunit ribosomal protein L21
MFAVVRTGGKQYRVAAGDKIAVEKIPGEAGDSVTLADVLLAGEGAQVKAADGLTVAAEIIAQAKGEKVIVFKKRRRHNYRRKAGHRQQYTILRITAIGDHRADDSAPAASAAAPAADAGSDSAAPKKAKGGKGAKAAEAGLVAQDGPLKVDGAESMMVDAPAAAKTGVETVAADAEATTSPTTGEAPNSEAPKKKSTRKAKSDTDAGEAAARQAPEGDAGTEA